MHLAFRLADAQVLLDLLELRGGVDRADVGVLVERVADDQRLHPLLELGDHFLRHRFLHQQPRARAADMALVEEDAVDDPFDGLVDRRIREDDIRGLAAELERVVLRGAGEPALDQPADFGRAGERDLVDVLVLNECGARFARAGDDVDHARGQIDIAHELGQLERRERRRLRRLEHHRVAAGERRRDLPSGHQQRKVPGNDLARDTQCRAHAVREMRIRACPPSRRNRRSARRPAEYRRRAIRGSACRRRATRWPRIPARVPAACGRCDRCTCRARQACSLDQIRS